MVSDRKLEILAAEELGQVAGGYDDFDWCGTKYPGWRPKPEPTPWLKSGIGVATLDAVALNPQPLPPRAGFGV